ncbi:hypothetical protein [Desnuesiella massiliensis]|uniref:hypothetical protein n=1 Tax=Desnuesiella massiliensis TaxID=1650662 RepID=UPI0006E3FE3B|nr:hypothetical protein [Desnuesiella massiliensis]
MFSVNYDKGLNRIYISITDTLSESEIKKYIEDMITILNYVKPGFTVCTDLSNASLEEIKSGSKFNSIREKGIEKGIKAVAVVLSTDMYTLYSEGHFPHIKNAFNSLNEVEEFLNLV